MEVTIKHRIWLESDGVKFMGKGHLQLLRAIQKTGSLNAASKETGISYRKTWRLINQINARAKQEVVQLKKGGAGGGGATVTAYGNSLVVFFESLLQSSTEHLEKALTKQDDLWE